MIRLGIFGTGHLGRIHLRCLQEASAFEVIGFYDPDDANAAETVRHFNIRRFATPEALLRVVDAVDIVASTKAHFELASLALQHRKHLFVEKPLAASASEATRLVQMAERARVAAQVGHVERFNPAFLALKDMALQPMFIEAHRLAPFNSRGADVSVVADLMIHDIDLVLHLVNSPVVSVSASGVPLVTSTPDIANARIEFENGCVANLTASRISLKLLRKMRLFQPDAYLSLDFLEKSTQVVRLYDSPASVPEGVNVMELDTGTSIKYLHPYQAETPPINAIVAELQAFSDSIKKGTTPAASFYDGLRALELAERVEEEIEERIGKVVI